MTIKYSPLQWKMNTPSHHPIKWNFASLIILSFSPLYREYPGIQLYANKQAPNVFTDYWSANRMYISSKTSLNLTTEQPKITTTTLWHGMKKGKRFKGGNKLHGSLGFHFLGLIEKILLKANLLGKSSCRFKHLFLGRLL